MVGTREGCVLGCDEGCLDGRDVGCLLGCELGWLDGTLIVVQHIKAKRKRLENEEDSKVTLLCPYQCETEKREVESYQRMP